MGALRAELATMATEREAAKEEARAASKEISALRVQVETKAREIENAKQEAQVASEKVSTWIAATEQAQVATAVTEKRLEEAKNHWQNVAENERRLRIAEEQQRKEAQIAVERYQNEAQHLRTQEKERKSFVMERDSQITKLTDQLKEDAGKGGAAQGGSTGKGGTI